MATKTSVPVTLELSRVFAAPRNRVFAAWTDSEAIKQWFGPPSCNVTEADFTPRVGGQYHIKIDNVEMGEIELTGTFREVVAPEKLVFTWQWLTSPLKEAGETLVTVQFIDRGRSTEIRLTHEGFPEAEVRDDHHEGWSGSLDKLGKYLG